MLDKTFEELKLTGELPSPTVVGMRILELTRSDDYSAEELGDTIRTDSALTGRILKLANSAANTGVEPATTVTDSIMRLGTRTVRDLSMAFTLVSANGRGSCSSFDYDHYWARSLARAVCAQEISRALSLGKPEETYICALLAEVGVTFRPELSPAASDRSPGPMEEIVAEARRRFVRCYVGMDGLALLLRHPAVLKVAPDFPVMPLAPGGAS